MAINSESLRKILELEIKKGCPDTTVFGGLDRFLANWVNQAKAAITDRNLLKQFSAVFQSKTGYAGMDPDRRKKWIDQVLAMLQVLENPAINTAVISQDVVSDSGKGHVLKIARRKKTADAVHLHAAKAKEELDASITEVKGISEALKKKFEKLGVTSIRDLLYFFPNRHIDYSQRTFINRLIIGAENTIIATVWEAREVQTGTRRSTEATVGDETGNMRVVWFNQPYLAKSIKAGEKLVISGRVTVFAGMPVFESPEWEPYEEKELIHTGRLIPVYPLTQGLSQRQLRRIVKPAVDYWVQFLDDHLPLYLRNKLHLMDLKHAIAQAHYPDDEAAKNEARRRLAFDELFLLQLGVLKRKRFWQKDQPALPFKIDQPELKRFLDSLPYQLTQAQEKALKEILNDLAKPVAMSRLLQGEVGSGKTVVATAALILAVINGYQGAIMAPTEILADQHFKTMRTVLSRVAGSEPDESGIYGFHGFLSRQIRIALLTGDLPQQKKKYLQQQIASGEVDIVIGTHALIQEHVEFRKLALVVIDEQHRFGVEQRSALRQKGTNPHVLVMTATPIPRTLALTLYGDLDLSVIDQLPPGRQEIKTRWLKPEQRAAAYHFLRQQIQKGRQAFIICPLVEESEAIQAKAAVAEYERLSREVFPDLKLGLLHGRMSPEEKESVMKRFHAGEMDILVSTPVVEVGIDVPNATVMLIESADRFGLSQLHQFRGRVGRGTEQSYCMLLAEKPTDIGKERLDLIEKVHNGFQLAEEDLKLRGPGEFFGTRQSGLPDLKMARLSDVALLELARQEAIELFRIDSELSKPEHRLLAAELERVWRNRTTGEWS